MTNKIDKSIIGHSFIPNWLNEPGEVIEISSKNAVRIWFLAGPKRWYKPSSFRNNFHHDPKCILCSELQSK